MKRVLLLYLFMFFLLQAEVNKTISIYLLYDMTDKEIYTVKDELGGNVTKIQNLTLGFNNYFSGYKNGKNARVFRNYTLKGKTFEKIFDILHISYIEPYNDCFTQTTMLKKAKKKAIILAKYAQERADRYDQNIVTYKKWFGVKSDHIDNSYDKIYKGLINEDKPITFDCSCLALPVEANRTLAYSYDKELYYINICNKELWENELIDHGFNSRAGTIIHEMSHFVNTAGTIDVKDENGSAIYGVADCKQLAIDDPRKARNNADNFAFFAEDTMSYFTIVTEVEKTETVEPMMRTGGRKLNLKTITTKETKQVVGIDPIVGKIINVPFVEETSGKKTSEKYELDLLSCMYRVKLEQEEQPYYKASFTYLNDFSPSNEFTENTVLDLQISAIKDKVIPVRWETLKKSGQFSYMSHWTQKKTQIEKETETKGIFKLNPEGEARLAEQKMISDLVRAFGRDTEDTGCLLQREYYDVLENGANITHPKVSYSYKVNITQSTESDINATEKIIERMEKFSGSYTEEKQIYDILNNPLYAPKIVEKEKTFSSGKKTNGILDTLLPDVNPDISDEMTIDNLQMFTN